ncbi:MAG: hypothetical protein C0448_03065 [Sphingobacteriaceae bacterium]|nr:hypothetical protein [Sphingobacteriaceae bacterium]
MKDQLRNSIWILSFVFIALVTKAQLYPTDKAVLRYTQIMFEYPQVPNAEFYKIEIAKNVSGSFDKNKVYSATDSSIAHLVSGCLSFGNSYKWHYSAYSVGKKIFTSKDFSFEIFKTNLVTDFRANVTVYDSSKYDAGLILLDNGVVIDRAGNLVLVTDSFGIEKRDFSLTSNGTLTYLQTVSAYERTLNGDLIWKTKELKTEKEIINGYHHDLIKLNNGNYLVMCKIVEFNNPSFRKNLDEAIVELDAYNNIVWLWKECVEISDTSHIKKTHLNSIFLNEEREKLFVSARDINTIFRIDRKTSKIESCIGTLLNQDSEHYPQKIFYGQHAAQLLDNGNILLFNNNTKLGKNNTSSIMEINQPSSKKKSVIDEFIYLYEFDNADENYCAKGGDVNKLRNGNYLISSSANNRNFEISSSRKIVWQCRPEKLDTINKRWVPAGSYRINYVKNLYPFYYTVEFIYSKNKAVGFKIANKGFNDTEYMIVFKSKSGEIIKQIEQAVDANQVFKMPFDLSVMPGTTISIQSKDNVSSIKTLIVK